MIAQNMTFDEIAPGQSAEALRRCTPEDLVVFANASGNRNPLHYAAAGGLPPSVPGMFMAAALSALLGSRLPGPGTVLRRMDLAFPARAQAGDEILARVTVLETHPPARVILAGEVRGANGRLLAMGTIEIDAPRERISFETDGLPRLIVDSHPHFEALLARAARLPPLVTAVVCPEEETALAGALLGMDRGIITPVLVGDPARIAAAAAAIGRPLAGIEVIAAADGPAAAARAVALVREGRAGAVMKGHLHTDDLLHPILAREGGLRTGRRLSHVYVMDVPGLAHPLLVTDAAINIAPDLAAKVDICQNAIDLALSLGIAQPKVGVLSATETVTPAIPSSLDAALLSKMAERGQIRGGVVDGPLAMDNAVDLAAARIKGLHSAVAGQAEVLVVPGLDAGNMLAKQLTHLGHAEAAGVVIGAQVPVILSSRSDSEISRLASCAVAALHHARLTGRLAEGGA